MNLFFAPAIFYPGAIPDKINAINTLMFLYPKCGNNDIEYLIKVFQTKPIYLATIIFCVSPVILFFMKYNPAAKSLRLMTALFSIDFVRIILPD